MSFVSIITTTYKHKDFIIQAIESVLAQTFTNWELLIGDDSPDDATWNIIQGYAQKYPDKIRAWHHNPNKGLTENMQFLFSQVSSESEYISFLEGDDVYFPFFLERKMQIFHDYPETVFIYNECNIIDWFWKITETNFLKNHHAFFPQNESIQWDKFLGKIHYCSYSSFTVKRNILEKYTLLHIPQYPRFGASDWDLFFRITTENPVFCIQEPLTFYRKHGNNLSWSFTTDMFNFMLVLDSYHKKMPRYFHQIVWQMRLYEKIYTYLYLSIDLHVWRVLMAHVFSTIFTIKNYLVRKS